MTTSLSREPTGQPPTAVTEAGTGSAGIDRVRRRATALALFLAPLGLVIANTSSRDRRAVGQGRPVPKSSHGLRVTHAGHSATRDGPELT